MGWFEINEKNQKQLRTGHNWASKHTQNTQIYTSCSPSWAGYIHTPALLTKATWRVGNKPGHQVNSVSM
jgi:hypothetical protein